MSQSHWDLFTQRIESNLSYVMGKNNPRRIKQLLSAIKNSGKVLELGCRTGIYTESLVEQASQITATDQSDDYLAATAHRFREESKVKVEKANCFFLPYLDNTFDTVVMSHLLHKIPNQERALIEIRRVLKPSGRLYIISDTCEGLSFISRTRLHLRHWIVYRQPLRYAVNLTPTLTESLCRAAGFNEIQCQVLGHRVKAIFALAEST